MSWTLVAHGTANYTGASTGCTTGSLNTTGADLIIIGVAQYMSSGYVTVSDSKGNTWTALTALDDGSFDNGRLYYCVSPTVDAAHTFSLSGNNAYATMFVAAFSGSDTSSAFDLEGGAQAVYTTGSFTTASITPSQANDLIVSLIGTGAAPLSGGFSIGSGFTVTDSVNYTNGSDYSGALAYLFQGAAAAVNTTWTWSGTASIVLSPIAAFKMAAGGGGSTYAVTVSESYASSDSQNLSAIFAPSVTESSTATDSFANTAIFSALLSESESFTDLVSAGGPTTYSVSVSESASALDAVSASAIFVSAVTESDTVTDSSGASAIFVPTSSESGTLSDSQSNNAIFAPSITEAETATDAFDTIRMLYNVSVAETDFMFDVQSATGGQNATVTIYCNPFLASPGKGMGRM
jgi:hypothetical protein